MSEQLALVETQEVKPQLSGLELMNVALQQAIAQGNAVEVVRELVRARAEAQEYHDREMFNAALQRIQSKLKPIAKTGKNPETNSKFATAGAIDRAIESHLREERMTLSFEPEPHPQPDMVRIVGVLSLGAYGRRYPLDIPADGKGPKGGGVMSRTHATGSAITYGKRYLKNMIFNLSFEERDDDGNKAAGKGLSDAEYTQYEDNIKNAANDEELRRVYKLAQDAAWAANDKASADSFSTAKNARYRDLHRGAR